MPIGSAMEVDNVRVCGLDKSQEAVESEKVLTASQEKVVECSKGVTEGPVREGSLGESSDDEFYEALEEHEEDVGQGVSSQTVEDEDECGERDERGNDEKQIQDGTFQSITVNESITIPDSNIGGHVTGISGHVTDESDRVTGKSGHVIDKSGHVTGISGHVTDESMGRLQLCGDLILIATGHPLYIPVTQVRGS